MPSENRDHETVYDDGDTIAFLNKYPTLPGHSLVYKRKDLADDMTAAEYPATRSVARMVARGLKQIVATKLMSLGGMRVVTRTSTGTLRRGRRVCLIGNRSSTPSCSRPLVLGVESRSQANLVTRLRASIEADGPG